MRYDNIFWMVSLSQEYTYTIIRVLPVRFQGLPHTKYNMELKVDLKTVSRFFFYIACKYGKNAPKYIYRRREVSNRTRTNGYAHTQPSIS